MYQLSDRLMLRGRDCFSYSNEQDLQGVEDGFALWRI